MCGRFSTLRVLSLGRDAGFCGKTLDCQRGESGYSPRPFPPKRPNDASF